LVLWFVFFFFFFGFGWFVVWFHAFTGFPFTFWLVGSFCHVTFAALRFGSLVVSAGLRSLFWFLVVWLHTFICWFVVTFVGCSGFFGSFGCWFIWFVGSFSGLPLRFTLVTVDLLLLRFRV